MRRSLRQSVAFALMVVIACLSAARGADVSVRAALSSATTELGEPVQLQIHIENARGRIMGPEVSVDGLDILYRGTSQSQQMQFGNAGFTSGTQFSLNYEV